MNNRNNMNTGPTNHSKEIKPAPKKEKKKSDSRQKKDFKITKPRGGPRTKIPSGKPKSTVIEDLYPRTSGNPNQFESKTTPWEDVVDIDIKKDSAQETESTRADTHISTKEEEEKSAREKYGNLVQEQHNILRALQRQTHEIGDLYINVRAELKMLERKYKKISVAFERKQMECKDLKNRYKTMKKEAIRQKEVLDAMVRKE